MPANYSNTVVWLKCLVWMIYTCSEIMSSALMFKPWPTCIIIYITHPRMNEMSSRFIDHASIQYDLHAQWRLMCRIKPAWPSWYLTQLVHDPVGTWPSWCLFHDFPAGFPPRSNTLLWCGGNEWAPVISAISWGARSGSQLFCPGEMVSSIHNIFFLLASHGICTMYYGAKGTTLKLWPFSTFSEHKGHLTNLDTSIPLGFHNVYTCCTWL